MKNLLTEISQIGVAVSDLEAAIAAMRCIFGVEPDEFLGPSNAPRLYHGRKVACETKIALYRFANIEIELIEPVCGESVWSDFVRDKGTGVQHLKFSVDSFAAAAAQLGAAGYLPEMEGDSARTVPGLKWAYFDTGRDLGYSVEIFNDKEVCAARL
ncbi:MAG: VOC family protein [Candidatus Pelethousia sp.]|nr:VOC family protein [Candidatus Pelethousia sp.]